MSESVAPDVFAAFHWAVIRLATFASDAGARPRLLFGSVSLLTSERPCPRSSTGVDLFPLAQGKGGTVVYRRVVLERDQAISWYRSASSEDFRTPVPMDPREVESTYDGQSIAVSDFLDDPRWPVLGFPTGADLLLDSYGPGSPAPFIGSGSAPARIHRRLGDNAGLKAVVADSSAVRFLKRRLHVDLADYSEYLGSLALVVPNPILRNVTHFFVPGADADTERLVFRLIPRPGQSAEGLHLTVFERRGNLLSRFDTVIVGKNGFVEMNDQAPVEASGYVVAHVDHGVLVFQPPLHFLRSIRMTMNVVGEKGEKQRSKDVGDDAQATARSRVAAAEIQREARSQAHRYGQMWVDDSNREAALLTVRSRILRARNRVIISGSLIGTSPFLEFLATFPKTDVPAIFLASGLLEDDIGSETTSEVLVDPNSAPGVISIGNRSATARLQAECEMVVEFRTALTKLGDEGGARIEAVVVGYEKLPAYDILLVVDESVWLLGGLFNTMRGRGSSLMLMLPDGEPEIRRHEELLAQSISIEAYQAELALRCEHYAQGK